MAVTAKRSWKRSVQPRRQRKLQYNAPLHVLQTYAHAHLSKELRAKHSKRSAQLKVGDKVRVMRGTYAKKEGKVSRVDLKRRRIYVEGVAYTKRDGTNSLVALRASNLMITELNLGDSKRKAKLSGASKTHAKKGAAQTNEKSS